MKHLCILALAAFTFLAPHQALGQLSPREFFAMAPASIFYTEDQMSDGDKAAIIKNGFKATTTFSCKAWGVAEETSQSLILRYCKDSFVRIRVYPTTGQDTIVIVQSARSSGRASDLQFFRVSVGSKELSTIPADKLQTIGIEPVTENDLVTKENKFKEGEAESAHLLLDDDGRLRVNVDTWMNPRWAEREIAYDVVFDWSGDRFQKRILPLALR